MSELQPCPFCGAGETRIRENRTSNAPRMDGKEHPLISVEITHWCGAEPGQPNRNTVTRVGRDHTAALAAWNRRAPSAEETRLRAEIASLRVTLGHQSATEDAEPIGCPIPGMCSAVNAAATGYREGAEAMQEAAAKEVDCGCACRSAVLAAKTSIDRTYACGRDPCGAEAAAAIRALPLPEPRQ